MALYHTHRPQAFSTVLGQKHIIQTITNQIKANTVAHAYLFFGPRGIGKTTTARLLAKAVNCLDKKDKDAEPCNSCTACTSITAGNAIDVIEIDAASHTGVDHVREHIIENAQFKPTTLKKKVFIIDEVHMLSTSAFNALLKTLEEPPEHVMFILATTELHKLPDTIISRCQRFTFQPIPHDELHTYLKSLAKIEGTSIDDAVLRRIIVKSDGCARDAINLLEQVLSLGEKNITEETVTHVLPPVFSEDTRLLVLHILGNKPSDALEVLHHMHAQNMHMTQCMDNIIDFLRTLMITSVNQAVLQDYGFDKELKKQIQAFHKQLPSKHYIGMIESAIQRRMLIKQSPIATLPIELFIIEWTDNTTAEKTQTPPTEEKESSPVEKKAPTPPPKQAKKKDDDKKEEKIEEKTEEVKEKKEITPLTGDITKESVLSIWNNFLEQVEQKYSSLVYIVKTMTIEHINDAMLTFSVPFSFHKDKLTEINCQQNVTDILSHLLGGTITYNITVTKKEDNDNAGANANIKHLAAAFGGEVV
ncbi:MAG: DNA polymerase III subunit gamma/tau [Candidatus Magasanikbacteria bacterium]|jgi:DNA polymerase III subunit gamma/tau|nr:DNA polymerase III subunit gamma/tau [Candidatus Magasanikbacteria bacterium]MBT4071309.1 DNA polymerase III subunit gamma/tau [Candidatus Magasanikbacteria bacterium]